MFLVSKLRTIRLAFVYVVIIIFLTVNNTTIIITTVTTANIRAIPSIG